MGGATCLVSMRTSAFDVRSNVSNFSTEDPGTFWAHIVGNFLRSPIHLVRADDLLTAKIKPAK